jgi:hypothetical protein
LSYSHFQSNSKLITRNNRDEWLVRNILSLVVLHRYVYVRVIISMCPRVSLCIIAYVRLSDTSLSKCFTCPRVPLFCIIVYFQWYPRISFLYNCTSCLSYIGLRNVFQLTKSSTFSYNCTIYIIFLPICKIRNVGHVIRLQMFVLLLLWWSSWPCAHHSPFQPLSLIQPHPIFSPLSKITM